MKIAAIQLQAVKGNIAENTARHLKCIELAAAAGAQFVYFPELSLTGFEPQLAGALALQQEDSSLDAFQQWSDTYRVIIGIGLPLVAGADVQIGMVWFTPHAPRRRYAKQQLHPDELPFFVPGHGQLMLAVDGYKLAPAICYEALQTDHAEQAAAFGAQVYLASVAKPARGIAQAKQHFPAIASQHGMYVILANCIGPSDNFFSVGQSAVWNPQGQLLAQLDDKTEGMVVVDLAQGRAGTQNFYEGLQQEAKDSCCPRSGFGIGGG